MAIYHLPNGRLVSLARFKMVGTYTGCLEGSVESISQYLRENLAERAAKELPPAFPLAMIPPPKGKLPRWMCVAELVSREAVQSTDPGYISGLYVCWFVENTSLSIDAMIESTLPHLNWEQTAEDYDMIV